MSHHTPHKKCEGLDESFGRKELGEILSKNFLLLANLIWCWQKKKHTD